MVDIFVVTASQVHNVKMHFDEFSWEENALEGFPPKTKSYFVALQSQDPPTLEAVGGNDSDENTTAVQKRWQLVVWHSLSLISLQMYKRDLIGLYTQAA